MADNTEETTKHSNEPGWMLIVQAIGIGCVSFVLIPIIEAVQGEPITWMSVIFGCSTALLGIALLMRRKSGCILFLGIFGVNVFLSIFDALGFGQLTDLPWFDPKVDAIIYSLLWLFGVFLFIKNRQHFV